jgi:hypothetical protein
MTSPRRGSAPKRMKFFSEGAPGEAGGEGARGREGRPGRKRESAVAVRQGRCQSQVNESPARVCACVVSVATVPFQVRCSFLSGLVFSFGLPGSVKGAGTSRTRGYVR